MFMQAWENMERMDTPILRSVEGILGFSDSDENLLKISDKNKWTPEGNMYVLSNTEMNYGAALMVCPDVLENISALFSEGFYIIPSSVHEVLIVPKERNLSPKDLGVMLREINQKEVAKEEVLSDRVYTYDYEKQKICQIPESIPQEKSYER